MLISFWASSLFFKWHWSSFQFWTKRFNLRIQVLRIPSAQVTECMKQCRERTSMQDCTRLKVDLIEGLHEGARTDDIRRNSLRSEKIIILSNVHSSTLVWIAVPWLSIPCKRAWGYVPQSRKCHWWHCSQKCRRWGIRRWVQDRSKPSKWQTNNTDSWRWSAASLATWRFRS